MKTRALAVLTTLLAMPAQAGYYDAFQIDNIYANESSGLRFYQQGEYGKAFRLLSETAALGMKQSQYILGFMFMKGEGVDKNMLFGLAWMSLATESGNEDWMETYDRLYGSLNDAQRSMVDQKVDEYRAKFGASAQGITCAMASVVGSRKKDWVCRKSEGYYEEYEIELPIRAE